MNKKILAVDDDLPFLISLKKLLVMKGYKVEVTEKSEEAIGLILNNSFQSVLLDVNMPQISGLELLDRITKIKPSLPIIMISGQGNIKVAVEAIKQGAFDFIEKPVDPEKLFIVLNNAVKRMQLVSEIDSLQNIIDEEKRIIGNSRPMIEIMHTIEGIANTKAKVLITGESGTGKELIAFHLFSRSNRKSNPYIKINCAAIPGELLESILFGHKKGSFTGAQQDRIGKFIAADGGTLFLDEIGDMNLELQAKLLRVLDDGEVEIVGENFPKKVDVRVISATNKNLIELIEEKRFREDLYHRLNVVNISIPPLRERREDISPLIKHFINRYSTEYNKPVLKVSRQAESILENYNWPGNIRELRNVVEKLVLFSSGAEIKIDDVYKSLKFPEDTSNEVIRGEIKDLKTAKIDFERRYILKVLDENDWKINECANLLGIDRTNLFKKMQALEIQKDKT